VVAAEEVRGRHAAGLVGAYSLADGLGRLLEDTDLGFQIIGPRTLLVRRDLKRPAAVRPPPPRRAASPPADVLEEVIVTARRQEENAQAVPVTLTVVGAQALQQQDVRTVDVLSRNVPGLSVCCGRGNTVAVFLRGIPGVVGYFAEVPVSGGGLAGLNGSALFFDLASVQTLKGPQGTLFGLNADAGAILFEPQRPTGRREGYGQVTLGSGGRHTAEGVANVPLAGGKLLLRLGGQHSHSDGTLRDLTQGVRVNDEDFWVGRLALTLRPSDSVDNLLLANAYVSHSRNAGLAEIAINPAGPALARFPGLQDALDRQRALGFTRIVGSELPTSLDQRQLNIVDIARWRPGGRLALKNIVGYSEVAAFSRGDFDGTPFPVLDAGVFPSERSGPITQLSEEFQAQGRALGNRLSYTLGTFHSAFRRVRPRPSYNIVLGTRAGTLSDTGGATHAIYGQGSLDLSRLLPGLGVTAGYRYTWDRRRASQVNLDAGGAALASFAARGSWQAPGYTLSLTWQATPDVLLYVTDAKGYSSGGFNLTSPVQYRQFDPETLNNVEGGLKADWHLGAVQARTNLGFFYGFYDNVQVPVVQTVETATGPALSVVTQNAATAHIQGLDAEATLIPVDGLELSGTINVMTARYDRYRSGGQDLSGTPFLYTPQVKYALHARWRLPLHRALGTLSVAGDYTWQSHQIQNTEPNPYVRRPGQRTLALSLDWTGIAGRPLDASLFATNVTNNRWTNGGSGAYSSLGIFAIQVYPPRMVGVRLRYRFDGEGAFSK
jgi:iron complex outermembrane receptor protein